ncbi:MAG: single-stranded DNA-binding protein [Spirochaetes bacterium]|nr:single-stranded DNA-binding protein [Spirochaetota bacterium]
MAGSINHVVLVGNLTRNAELKYTNSGTAISAFSLAVNQRRKKDDQWVDESHFFDVEYWGKAAEAVNQYLVKGKQVGVEGSLRQDRWEKDGQTRSKVKITASNVMLLGGRPQGQTPNAGPQPSGGQEPAESGPPADTFEDDIPF